MNRSPPSGGGLAICFPSKRRSHLPILLREVREHLSAFYLAARGALRPESSCAQRARVAKLPSRLNKNAGRAPLRASVRALIRTFRGGESHVTPQGVYID